MSSEIRDHPLEHLGREIRRRRRELTWSRRRLAEAARVSERHLAKLEGGTGNISVTLLSRIAAALGSSVRELFADHDAIEQQLIAELVAALPREGRQEALRLLRDAFPAPGAGARIALVGLRGAGKSTLGRIAAARLDMPFIRLRDLVEEIAGMNVSEIFALSGEAHYRRLEQRALESGLAQYHRGILETGGSIVMRPRLLNLLLASCRVIWIAARPQDHMQRVIDQADLRPMVDHEDAMAELRRILDERTPFYRQAHAVVETSGRSVDDCATELTRLITAPDG